MNPRDAQTRAENVGSFLRTPEALRAASSRAPGPEAAAVLDAAVLDVLGLEHDVVLEEPAPLPPLSAREAREEYVEWVRTFLVPWFGRRLTGRSSGDGIEPKRPTLQPIG